MENHAWMRPAFANGPTAILLAFTLGVWTLIEIRQSLNRRAEATKADRGSLLGLRLWAVAGALLAALAIRVRAAAFPESAAVTALGFLVMWSGIALRWWSFRTLGHYFTFAVMTSADQPVISAGPYAVLRHPSYLGILLILGGLGLGYGNWLSLAALTLVPLIGFIYRIRVEEAALSKTLGPAYTTYAAGRKRLIPYVW